MTLASGKVAAYLYRDEVFAGDVSPQSNGIAERLVGMSKMLVQRLLESSGLETFEVFYWNYAVAHAADLLRHRALKMTYPNPAFGETVGIYTSQDKGKVKALEPRGTVGRFLMCDTWWTDGVTHIVTSEDGDLTIKKGLKPLRLMIQRSSMIVGLLLRQCCPACPYFAHSEEA
eukprot:6282219-Amphidinium_carterae.1